MLRGPLSLLAAARGGRRGRGRQRRGARNVPVALGRALGRCGLEGARSTAVPRLPRAVVGCRRVSVPNRGGGEESAAAAEEDRHTELEVALDGESLLLHADRAHNGRLF